MPKRPLPWRRIHRLFDQLRRAYYLDAEAPLQVPPTAAGLEWNWTATNSGAWAFTRFDEDGHPYAVELHPDMRRAPNTLRLVLLHELSHMRNPRANCGAKSPWWRRESARIAALGGVRL